MGTSSQFQQQPPPQQQQFVQPQQQQPLQQPQQQQYQTPFDQGLYQVSKPFSGRVLLQFQSVRVVTRGTFCVGASFSTATYTKHTDRPTLFWCDCSGGPYDMYDWT